jgi:circadian clock protein KaiC
MAQHGLVGDAHVPLDLSFMADGIVLLRYFEAEGDVRKAISVLKSRSGEHESTIREYTLSTKSGVTIGEPIRAFQGVLTGIPSFVGRRETLAGTDDDAGSHP